MSRFLLQKYKSVLKLDSRLLQPRDTTTKQIKFGTPKQQKFPDIAKKEKEIQDSPIVTLTPVNQKYDKNKLTESYLIKAEATNQNLRVNQSLKDLAEANQKQQATAALIAGNTSTDCNTPINTPIFTPKEVPILAFPGPVNNILSSFIEIKPVLPLQQVMTISSPRRKHRIFTHKHQSPVAKKKARIFTRPATVNHFVPRTFQYISCPFDYLKDPSKTEVSLPFNKQFRLVRVPESIQARWHTLD